MLTVAPSSPEEGCRPEGRGYIVPEAPNLTVASDARSGRILIAEDQVVYFKQQSHSRDFVSHSNVPHQPVRAEYWPKLKKLASRTRLHAIVRPP